MAVFLHEFNYRTSVFFERTLLVFFLVCASVCVFGVPPSKAYAAGESCSWPGGNVEWAYENRCHGYLGNTVIPDGGSVGVPSQDWTNRLVPGGVYKVEDRGTASLTCSNGVMSVGDSSCVVTYVMIGQTPLSDPQDLSNVNPPLPPPPPPAPVLNFSVRLPGDSRADWFTRIEIEEGDSVELYWYPQLAEGCWASGDWSGQKMERAISGYPSETVTPTRTSTYMLQCDGYGGFTEKASVTVTVVPQGTRVKALPGASITAPSCMINAGASSCETTISWVSSTILNPSLKLDNVVVSTASSSQGVPVSLGYGSHDVTMYDGIEAKNSAHPEGICEAGTRWLGSSCGTPTMPGGGMGSAESSGSPDLIPVGFSIEPAGVAYNVGETVTLMAWVRNQGDASVGAPFETGFINGANLGGRSGMINSMLRQVGLSFESIAPFSRFSYTNLLPRTTASSPDTATFTFTEAGRTQYLTYCVDTDGVVNETLEAEGNNCATIGPIDVRGASVSVSSGTPSTGVGTGGVSPMLPGNGGGVGASTVNTGGGAPVAPTVSLEICESGTAFGDASCKTSGTLTVESNEDIKLRWSSTADTCSALGFSTGGATSGTRNSPSDFLKPTPGTSGAYRVVCSGAGGTGEAVVVVDVNTPFVEPSMVFSKNIVRLGDPITITWDTGSHNPTIDGSCTLTGPGGYLLNIPSQTGQTPAIEINGQSTFTLSCSSGNVTRTVSVIASGFES